MILFKIDINSLRVISILALIIGITSGFIIIIIIIIPNAHNKPALAQQQQEEEQQQQQNIQSALSIVGSMRENGNNLTTTNGSTMVETFDNGAIANTARRK